MVAQEIRFTLSGPVVAWHRSKLSRTNRIDGRGIRVFKEKADREYQLAIAVEATAALMRWRHESGVPWSGDGEWHLDIEWHLQDLTRRDIDNLEKNILDALSTIIYDNDCQVVSVSKFKRLNRATPKTVVAARRVSGFLSE